MPELVEHRIPGSGLRIVLESDERVAYAYLLDGDRVVGDVWLWNVAGPAPDDEWADQSRMPFRNRREYMAEDETPPGLSEATCVRRDDVGEGVVDIVIGSRVVARLAPGARPGWSRQARKDSPLARVLPEWRS